MAKRQRMGEGELLAAIESREASAVGFESGELANQRAEAIRRFTGEKLGNEVEGRSGVVVNTLQSTYLWIAPQLLRVFLGTDEVVRFEARGPEDEASAQQETEVINWVATERNTAFIEMSAWFQDACLCGSGYIKTYWETDESVQVEKYFGKSDDELAMLMQDPEVEVVEHEQRADPDYVPAPQVDPQTGQPMLGRDGKPVVMPAPTLHDVVMRRKVIDEYARYCAVPPEELLVSRRARSVSLQEVDFVEHRRRVTLSELREMGYDVPDDVAGWYDDDHDGGDEQLARDRWSEDSLGADDDDGSDPSMRLVTYREAYVMLDYDGDGIAERRKVCIVGKRVLANEETDMVPFASLSPILFAHRHVGLSLYDTLREIEVLRTTITRAYLDGLYLTLNQRHAVDAGSVNMDDMLTVRPGGVVRTQGSPLDKVMPLPVPDVGPAALQGLQYVDQWRQDATGVSPYFQGGASLDAAALNKTATGVSQLISQAQMRVEAIARAFADTGVRDLFRLLHQLTLKHARKAMTVKLRNQWTVVDPREWKHRNNLVVTVALGAGTKEMRAAQLQQLIGLQMQLVPMGLATPDKIYNSVSRLANELGYRNPDEFVSNPAMQPPQPPPPPDPLVQAQQIKTQGELRGKQMQAQADAQKSQMDLQLKDQEMQARAQFDQMKAEQDAALEREKVATEASTRVEVARVEAQIKADTAIQIEQMKIGVADAERERAGQSESQMGQIVAALAEIQANQEQVAAAISRIQSPRAIVRDQRGRVLGTADETGEMVQEILRDETGRVAGVRPRGPIQ